MTHCQKYPQRRQGTMIRPLSSHLMTLPKTKVYHQSEILPSSCSRSSTSSSSSHDPSTAITPGHTPDDKDYHLTQTPGQETNNATSHQRPSRSRTPTYKGIPLILQVLSTNSPSFAHFRQRNVAEQGLTFYAQHVRSMRRWQRKVLKMAL